MVVLIYDRMSLDPRVAQLTDRGHKVWFLSIAACNRLGRDTVAVDEIELRDVDETAALEELVNAELAERLPGDHVRLLARLDLWAFDDDPVQM